MKGLVEALLEHFTKEFNEMFKYAIEIGVVSDNTERKIKVGITNSELMYIHENGSPLNNIPARPVLDMTIKYASEELLNDTIDNCLQIWINSKKSQEAVEKELNKLCLKMEKYARQLIYSNDGRLAPNAPSTVAKKGDNHPLFDTGQLARSITCRLIDLKLLNKEQ